MSDIQEIKSLFEATQRTAEAAKQKAEELEGKQADYLDRTTFDKIKDDLAGKYAAADKAVAELKAQIAALETSANRPGRPVEDSQEEKSFASYLRNGVESAEMKAMATTSGTDGGFMVTSVMRAGIQERLRRSSPIRQLANVVQFVGEQYQILVERGDTGFEWAGETATRNDTATPTIDRISISAHELSALPKVSQRMLDNVTFDVAGWLVGRIADKFVRAEATAFVSGSGVDRPMGFLSYSSSTSADDSRSSSVLQYRATGASGAFASSSPADVLRQTLYDMQPQYQANASWLMKNTTLAQVAVLKDSYGQFLLKSMMDGTGGIVNTIEGRPVSQADDMPAIAASSLSIAVGDFSAGYTIVDNPTVAILRDPFSSKPNVLFYATKRVGGGVTDFDAIKLIKFAAS